VRPVLVAVALLALVRVAGAEAEKSELRISPPLGCDRLTTSDGLPANNVRAIVQDKIGFIWFGTEDGLARYDGTPKGMHVYRPVEKDAASIASGYVTALALDNDGKIWVGSDASGVSLYDPNTDKFTRFDRSKGLTADGVTAILRDSKDRVWFAMSGGGLASFNRTTGSFEEHTKPPLDVEITALDSDKAGALWLGTGAGGVIRWNPDDNSSKVLDAEALSIKAGAISAVRVGSKGTVWIGSDSDGLRALAPDTGKIATYRADANNPASLSDDGVNTIYEDHNGTTWVGTRIGLTRIDANAAIVRFQADPDDPGNRAALSTPSVVSILQDRSNLIWLGGFTGGVCKFAESRQKFGYYRTRSLALSYYDDPDGTLWVGTYAGLYKYDWAKQKVTVYKTLGTAISGPDLGSLNSVWITSLHKDAQGWLWMGTETKGLVSFDPRTETYRRWVHDPEEPNTLPADGIFKVWEDKTSRLWLATYGGGLVRFDPRSEVFTAYTNESTNDAIPSDHLYTLYPDPVQPDILWLGTAKGGLVRFDTAPGAATGWRHDDRHPTTPSTDARLSIYRDETGNVWASTAGAGLNRLDTKTGKVERFTTANSALPDNTILSVLPDGAGKLWLATQSSGLVEFDPAKKTFVTYERADGAQENEFAQGSSMRSRDGRLFFGGPGGFNMFRPKEIITDQFAPPAVMTAFKVLNRDVKLDKPIWTLPKVQVSYADSFEVQFAALSFAAPEKNRFAYKLEGVNDDFIETDRPYASYQKLGGGTYKLRVRAANRHGVWNEAGVVLTIGVTPPWYRTWQAFLGYLAILFGAAYLVFRWQRARVTRAEREGRLAVVERDLELTGAVQSGFLPENNDINMGRMHVFGLYRPADACGGDWWWHESLPNGKHIIMVGDVTGHGPGPAMVTAAVATAFRVLPENGLEDAMHGLEVLNKEVLRVAKGKYHMTMAALEVDEESGHWTLYSAGAPPMLSLNANGKHRVHFCPGAPLGTEKGFEAGRLEGKFDPQTRIMLYTDGIPELEQPNGNALGMRKFAQQYELTKGHPLPSAAALILTQADVARGGTPQGDDWTFTLVEWH